MRCASDLHCPPPAPLPAPNPHLSPPEATSIAPSFLHVNPADNDNLSLPPAGCVWSENSCAYDVFVMTMFSMYQDASGPWRQVFRTVGPRFQFIANQFEQLLAPANLTDPQKFSECRDELRRRMSEYNASMFPPPGTSHTSIYDVFEAFEKNSHQNSTLLQKLTCRTGCSVERDILYLPGACSSGGWTNAARRAGFSYALEEASIQLFVDLQISAKISQGLSSPCSLCQTPLTSLVFLANPSPWLFFALLPGVCPRPQAPLTLEIRTEIGVITYRQSAMVYYDGRHFTGAWEKKDGSLWGYDGLARHGRPERLQSANLTALQDYAGGNKHIVLYALNDSISPS